MPTSDCFVSLVAVLHDDADIVESFVREAIAVLKREYANYELVLVDDGSGDDTAARVVALLGEERCIRLLRLSRHFGRDIAITAGLDTVIGDFVVVLDPESDPPGLVPEMVERCRRGPGVVYGVRRRAPAEPLHLRLGRPLFYRYFNRVLGIALPPGSTDFRAYSRQSVNAIVRIKDRLRYMRTFGTVIGFGAEPFPYDLVPRRARPRSRTLLQSVGLAVNMTVANSNRPLRFASFLALAAALVSAAVAVYALLVGWLARGVAPGWTTRQVFDALMFAVVFAVLGTLGEYMGRLLDEVKDRPLYFVREERDSSVLLVDEKRKNVVTETD